jgi:hypothetical protein
VLPVLAAKAQPEALAAPAPTSWARAGEPQQLLSRKQARVAHRRSGAFAARSMHFPCDPYSRTCDPRNVLQHVLQPNAQKCKIIEIA